MKTIFEKTKSYIIAHKSIGAVAVLLIILIGYFIYGKITSTAGETRYVLSGVTKETIVSSVTGSGQVSALNQIDIKPTVSGTITYISVQPGDKVSNGKLLFSIDSADAQKAVRDAEISLQSAQISLDKLKIQNSETNMNANLAQAYDDGFNTISNTFLDLPGIMSGLTNMFFQAEARTSRFYINWYSEQVGISDKDKSLVYKQNLTNSYNSALSAYNKNMDDYKNITRTSDKAIIENLISETYNTTKLLADTIKSANNYIDFVNSSMQNYNFDIPAIISTHKTTLSTFTSKTNSGLSSLLSTQTNIKNNKDAFPNTNLDIQSSELSLKQRENALQDTKDKLSDYYVRAPFAGTISSTPITKGTNVSSGTILGTIITPQQIATISLNEVDIAKIKLGQKTTLTFDAVPDLTIVGNVAQIDSIGTVSQGVVNYNVKIGFNTSDERIKPGMSVSAAIITDVKQDILVVPNTAIKNQGGSTYVEMFDTPLSDPLPGIQGSPSLSLPRKQSVVIGISSDSLTEIISGLKEGDNIVSKTIINTTTSSSTTPSLLNAVGGNNKGGTNATRALRGN